MFTAGGHLAFAHPRIHAEKLVLMATPPELAQILRSFCGRDGLSRAEGHP
jgi:hypothetical protein